MAAITGTIRRAGAPLEGAYVRLHGPSGEFVAEINTGQDGAFTFHVFQGSWELEARAVGAGPVTRTVDVAEDEAEITIDL